jgi:HSP20 family molecular chaperone IbpA
MNRDFFGDFNRELNDLFKLTFNTFNRPVKDMQPYRYIRKDNGFIFVINTLGIKREDIIVQVTNEQGDPYKQLRVQGKTEMERISFENSVDLAIRLKIEEEIEDVAYEVNNGLTIVYLKLKKVPKQEMNAKYLEPTEEFDF